MNTASMTQTAIPTAAELEAKAQALKTLYRRKVYFWRTFIIVIFLGAWELAGRLEYLDPFRYSMPSAIWARLIEWITEGTSEGPLWYHLWVTMEESLLGFCFKLGCGGNCGLGHGGGVHHAALSLRDCAVCTSLFKSSQICLEILMKSLL